MSAYNPPTENVPIFDSSLFRQENGDTLTINIADKRYLRFPISQGSETLQDIMVSGVATFNNEIVQSGATRNITQDITTNTDPNLLKATDIYGDINVKKPVSATGGTLKLFDINAGVDNTTINQVGNDLTIQNNAVSGEIYFNTADNLGAITGQFYMNKSKGVVSTTNFYVEDSTLVLRDNDTITTQTNITQTAGDLLSWNLTPSTQSATDTFRFYLDSGIGTTIDPLTLSKTGALFQKPITMSGALNTDRTINNVFYNLQDSNNISVTMGSIYGGSGVFNYDNNINSGSHNFATNTSLGVQTIPLNFTSVDMSIATTNPPTCSAVQPVATDNSTIMPTTAWVQSAITAGGGGGTALTPNSVAINPTQVPNASGLAGITNPFNSSGFSAQFFSNVNHSFINIWVDFQGFNEGSVATYQDSLMVQVDIVWDGATNLTPSYGNCNFLCKLFPKRVFASPQWGTHFSGVSANTANSYTGLSAYNSTNASYAPYGRQYWCYNIQGSQTCNVYGGGSYCLFQFPNPMGGGNNYCCSTSIRVLDSTIVQTNPNPVANCGIKVYSNFQV